MRSSIATLTAISVNLEYVMGSTPEEASTSVRVVMITLGGRSGRQGVTAQPGSMV
jgi:hypothetical protein